MLNVSDKIKFLSWASLYMGNLYEYAAIPPKVRRYYKGPSYKEDCED